MSNFEPYNNKTVLVTGASGGIGYACAAGFAKAGYTVAAHYNNNKPSIDRLVREITAFTGNKYSVFPVNADISSGASVEKMFEEIQASCGSVDILINTAGISQQKLFLDITEEDWDNMFDINVKGMYNCIKASLPHMINKKRGKIINISSVWGITGASCEVHYSASKAAVIGLTKALAKELGPSWINVNCVAPGVVETPMLNGFSREDLDALAEETPLGRLGMPKDICDTILFLASDRADFITGQVISPNGGFVI